VVRGLVEIIFINILTLTVNWENAIIEVDVFLEALVMD
jgi:hypothetical protein